MGVVTVRNIAIGQGIPKICIPIVAPAREGILKEAKSLLSLPCDLVEWRCDWYEDIFAEGTGRILADLREILGDKPILCTFRTKEEGGARNASPAQYHSLICQMIEEASSDLVDLELFSLSGSLKQLTALAREKGVKTIVSSHDFSRTPSREEMLNRLLQMEEGGGGHRKACRHARASRGCVRTSLCHLPIFRRGRSYPPDHHVHGGTWLRKPPVRPHLRLRRHLRKRRLCLRSGTDFR